MAVTKAVTKCENPAFDEVVRRYGCGSNLAAALGVRQCSIHHVANGNRGIGPKLAKKFAKLTGRPAADFLTTKKMVRLENGETPQIALLYNILISRYAGNASYMSKSLGLSQHAIRMAIKRGSIGIKTAKRLVSALDDGTTINDILCARDDVTKKWQREMAMISSKRVVTRKQQGKTANNDGLRGSGDASKIAND